ncbi:MAG TPA: hypothetical protein DHW02_25185, partial [Ktedonobacter sp.]|nr:hypothetical protein [Ktedonobacter sp.]
MVNESHVDKTGCTATGRAMRNRATLNLVGNVEQGASMNHITKQHREPSTPNISSGHYRLSEGVHVRRQNDEYFALCDYPLRVTKLPSTVAKLLTLCEEEHTCEELSTVLGLPVARVEALCDQLHEKSLLDAGPPQLVEAYLHVSIVIPSYNRAQELERCIRSLLTLNYPLNLLEIVVVDDASTDDTLQILCSLTSELAFQQITLRVIQHEQQRGVAVARNSGTQAASHEVIAYI